LGDEDFVLITAQPDCDLKWLESLDDEAIRELDMNETLSLIEKRNYRFHCGCSPEKIFPVIANMSEGSIDSIFGKSEIIPAGCPRCGAKYSITREALEAFVKRDEDEESE
jgi:molecular chaperone Hsp33